MHRLLFKILFPENSVVQLKYGYVQKIIRLYFSLYFFSVNVLCNDQLLHHIEANQFLDSPEYESTSRLDEKFKVSFTRKTICAAPCSS